MRPDITDPEGAHQFTYKGLHVLLRGGEATPGGREGVRRGGTLYAWMAYVVERDALFILPGYRGADPVQVESHVRVWIDDGMPAQGESDGSF